MQATNTILHYCVPWKPAIFVQGEDTAQVYNSRATDGDAWMQTTRHAELNVKIGPHFPYISVFSILLVFSSVLRFLDCFPVLVLLPYGY